MPPRLRPWGLEALFKRNGSPTTSCASASSGPSGAKTVSRTPIRTLVAAPKPGSGPLMTRRADRALPEVNSSRWKFFVSVPVFFVVVAGSTLAIFNYQKSNSSVVSSTLYALRTNEEARRALGDEVYFASRMPWIKGTIDQLHGKIDISYNVKGTKDRGTVRFKSERRSRMGYFETSEWSLTTSDGKTLHLLKSDKPDPFKNVDSGEDAMAHGLA